MIRVKLCGEQRDGRLLRHMCQGNIRLFPMIHLSAPLGATVCNIALLEVFMGKRGVLKQSTEIEGVCCSVTAQNV